MKTTDLYAALVLAVTVAKLAWDWIISPAIRARQKATESIDAKGRATAKMERDKWANYIAGILLVVLSALILFGAGAEDEVSRDEIKAIQERIDRLEQRGA